LMSSIGGSGYTVHGILYTRRRRSLSFEDVSRVRSEDLPRGLTLMVDVTINLGSVDATLYVERGVVELYVDVDWSYWSYAVSKREFINRLTKTLEKLG